MENTERTPFYLTPDWKHVVDELFACSSEMQSKIAVIENLPVDERAERVQALEAEFHSLMTRAINLLVGYYSQITLYSEEFYRWCMEMRSLTSAVEFEDKARRQIKIFNVLAALTGMSKEDLLKNMSPAKGDDPDQTDPAVTFGHDVN